MGNFNDHKELGAPSIVFVTPGYGLDQSIRKPHVHKISTPGKATGILSLG